MQDDAGQTPGENGTSTPQFEGNHHASYEDNGADIQEVPPASPGAGSHVDSPTGLAQGQAISDLGENVSAATASAPAPPSPFVPPVHPSEPSRPKTRSQSGIVKEKLFTDGTDGETFALQVNLIIYKKR